jgi:hypothetical protein
LTMRTADGFRVHGAKMDVLKFFPALPAAVLIDGHG